MTSHIPSQSLPTDYPPSNRTIESSLTLSPKEYLKNNFTLSSFIPSIAIVASKWINESIVSLGININDLIHERIFDISPESTVKSLRVDGSSADGSSDIPSYTVLISSHSDSGLVCDVCIYYNDEILTIVYNSSLFKPERMVEFVVQALGVMACGKSVGDMSLLTTFGRLVLPNPKGELANYEGGQWKCMSLYYFYSFAFLF